VTVEMSEACAAKIGASFMIDTSAKTEEGVAELKSLVMSMMFEKTTVGGQRPKWEDRKKHQEDDGGFMKTIDQENTTVKNTTDPVKNVALEAETKEKETQEKEFRESKTSGGGSASEFVKKKEEEKKKEEPKKEPEKKKEEPKKEPEKKKEPPKDEPDPAPKKDDKKKTAAKSDDKQAQSGEDGVGCTCLIA